MEELNHALLQDDPEVVTETPQLLLLSSHAARGTCSAATFSLVISIARKRGVALVGSGSTDTFMDYTFAGKARCNIISTMSKKVKVVGGGYLETTAIVSPTLYTMQHEEFCNSFELLSLKGYDVILGCVWIQQHSPIGFDLRNSSRELTILKNGTDKVTFRDFTNPLAEALQGRYIGLYYANQSAAR
jgi:hypothetical protein